MFYFQNFGKFSAIKESRKLKRYIFECKNWDSSHEFRWTQTMNLVKNTQKIWIKQMQASKFRERNTTEPTRLLSWHDSKRIPAELHPERKCKHLIIANSSHLFRFEISLETVWIKFISKNMILLESPTEIIQKETQSFALVDKIKQIHINLDGF